MAALLISMGCVVTACSDDDDENDGGRTEEERAQDPYEKNTEAGDALMTLLTQLAAPIDSLPDNWKSATFEPVAGVAVEGTFKRNITVASLNEALRRYNSLTGQDLPASTRSNTWEMPNVGTMTYTAVGGSDVTATIDVDVRQMPHLTQIRLIPATAIGENGSFKGEPYYRFGDVVKDKDGCCWICVRPAYSPDGKEDTHWMSFQMAKENIETVTGSSIKQQVLPTKLECATDKLDYLPQLLAILANPNGYKTLAGTSGNYYNGKGLGALQEDAMPVDSLVRQAMLWNANNVWDLVCPSAMNGNTFRSSFMGDVNLIYKKYSKSSKVYKLSVMQYMGAKSFFINIPTQSTPQWDATKVAFDITDRYVPNGIRNRDEYTVPNAYVVRYKTGFKLSTNWFFNPDPTKAIEGVTEVFRFNAHRNENVASSDALDGDGFFHIGDIISDNKTGQRWFCYQGLSTDFRQMIEGADDQAYFLSFDSIPDDSLSTGKTTYGVSNIIPESELVHAGLLFSSILKKCDENQLKGQDGFAITMKAFKDMCGVDMLKLFVSRDSIATINGKASQSKNHFLNIAYVDDARTYLQKGQPYMRVIYDMTGAGDGRVAGSNEWKVRFSKKYANSDERMYVTDIKDQKKVDQYGSSDPWVTLPYHGQEQRSTPRTKAYDFKYLSYFFWDTTTCSFRHPEATSMYNEPILFMRVMKLDNSENNKEKLKGYTLLNRIDPKFAVAFDNFIVSASFDATDNVFLDGVAVNPFNNK